MKKKFRTLRLMRKNLNVMIGGLIVIFFVILTVLGPFIAPYSPTEQVLERRLEPPSQDYILGTDSLGRDLLTRIIFGMRISFFVALLAVFLSLIIAIPLGLFSGYFTNSWFDHLIMRLMDVILSLPGILLAITIIVILGKGLNGVIIAVGIIPVPIFVRLIRNTTVSIKVEDFIKSAKAIGEKDSNIIFRYIFPEVFPVILTLATLQIGLVVLMESGLGFLGLGVQPPTPELGQMLGDSRLYLRDAPLYPIFIGLTITLITFAFNLLGDGLNDILNPKLRK